MSNHFFLGFHQLLGLQDDPVIYYDIFLLIMIIMIMLLIIIYHGFDTSCDGVMITHFGWYVPPWYVDDQVPH